MRALLTVRAVKMDRVGTICVVDEPNYRLSTLRHLERGTWRNSIITNEPSLAQIGVDLLLKGLDVDFIVIDWGTVGEGERP